MISGLDIRTILTLTAVMAALLALISWWLHRTFPASIRGLREWVWLPILGLLGSVLYSLNTLPPPWQQIVLWGGNASVLMAAVMSYAGTLRFYGETAPRWLLPSVFALGAVPIGIAILMSASYESRVLIFTSAIAVTFVLHMRLIWRHDHRSFQAVFTIGVLTWLTISVMARHVGTWMGVGGQALNDVNVMQTLYMSSYSIGMAMLSVAHILLATDRLRRMLEGQIAHDALTGAYTRRAILAYLEEARQQTRSRHEPLAVMLLDIDHFKQVNDKHGHTAGDDLLHAFVTQAQRLVKDTGRLGRYGGEEFLLVLPGMDEDAAFALGEAIVKETRYQYRPMRGATVSAGLALCPPGSVEETRTLLGRADKALSRAKRDGRDRIILA